MAQNLDFLSQFQSQLANASKPAYDPSSFLNPNKTPGTVNDAMNILQNPDVTTHAAQDNALNNLQGLGVNTSNMGQPWTPATLDPYQQLQQQMQQQLSGIGSQMTPDSVLRAQAASQAAAKYDPLITALQGQMNTTTNQGHANQQQARDMYGSLSSDIMNQIPGMQQQNQTQQQDVSKRYAQGASQMQQAYQNQAQQQQDLMTKLGIQAAAGDPRVQQGATDQQYFTNQNSADAQHQKDALQQIAATDTGYENKMASNAKLAGENQAQDIGKQLATYLSGANDKMTGLQSSKADDLNNFFNQLKSADAANVNSANNNAFNQMMAMNNFGLDATKAQNAQQQAQQDLQLKMLQLEQSKNGNILGNSSGMSGAANVLGQRYGSGNTDEATKLENILGQVLGSPEIIAGQHTSKDAMGANTMVNNNNEYVMQQLRNIAGQQGVQGGDINNLIDAYLAYKGQLH